MRDTMKRTSALLPALILCLGGTSVLFRLVQPVEALYSVNQPIVINADGSITPSDAPINNVGDSTYTMTDDINITSSSSGIAIKRSDITLDGNGHTLTGLGLGGDGISLIDGWANHVTVQNMTVVGFWDGIHLGTSSNNTIRGNSFSNCGGSLVVLGGSSNGNTIDKNNITSGNYGVELFYYSSNNNFTRNYIANNRFWAITLHLEAGNCTFYHNIVSGPVINDGPASTWDNGYPSGGNFWAGYISLDLYNGPYQNITGGDGIGDKAYLTAVSSTQIAIRLCW